jgi:hypothetical protein
VKDETRNTYILAGFAALGAYLFWANRPSKYTASEVAGSTPEEDAALIRRGLLGDIARSDVVTDDLRRLKRKLDRHAAEFDQEELARGARHELEHTRNPYIAQKIAMDHLRENPDYYRILEEVMPEEETG